MATFSSLNTAWFALIGLLWAGYFFLDGFDFGVAVLTPLVIRDETDRRLCLNAVGPTWDGNEVWLLVAGGATFAAFPLWYAKLFSGFYLALFLVLVALIARGVSFELRSKVRSTRARSALDWANFLGSLVPAIVWGVAFTDLAHGLPLRAGGSYAGGLLGLLHPVALLGGVASCAVFCLHGAVFLSLKTTGELARRARRLATTLAGPTAALAGGLVLALTEGRPPLDGELPAAVPLTGGLAAVVALAGTGLLVKAARDGWAFAATGLAILLLTGAAFARMFPAVLPSTAAGHALTIERAAAGHETLVVMSVVAGIFTPVVLAYQAWSYWVFRARLLRPPAGADEATSLPPNLPVPAVPPGSVPPAPTGPLSGERPGAPLSSP